MSVPPAGRTFPNHPYFSRQLGAGQLSLFNLLKAYSLVDKEVGYCQGLSFVAGVLLMHVSDTASFRWNYTSRFNLVSCVLHALRRNSTREVLVQKSTAFVGEYSPVETKQET